MTHADLTKIEGWDAIRELIPEGDFLRFTEIWSLRLEHYLDPAGDLRRQLILELCRDVYEYGAPTVRITMDQPGKMDVCPNSQIRGLGIDDFRQEGWEHTSYHLYDYEGSDWDVYCEGIAFSRGSQIPPYEG